MRRVDKETLAEKEQVAALGVCCAACHAVADATCVDTEGRPRKPHKVRISVGRWAAAKRSA